MIVIVMLLIVLSISFGIKIKLKIAQEEAIFVAVFGTVLFAYLFGLFNLLNFSIYLIGFASIISILYTITKLVKKEVKIRELITLPTIVYIGVICYIHYIVKDLTFSTYDEFMFWGTNLKQMVEKGCLWANYQIDGVHLVYPPFTAVTEYLFCKFNGSFNEGVAYLGIVSLIFTSLMPLFKDKEHIVKKMIKMLITIPITYIAIVLFGFNIANLAVDCIVGVLFAVAMYSAYRVEDKKDYIAIMMQLIALTLIKTNGILFAGIVIMQLFFRKILEIIKTKEKNKKEIAKGFIVIGILLLSIILAYATWKIYYTVNGKQIDDRHDKNYVQNIDVKEYANALFLTDKADERNTEIVKSMWDKIQKNKIIRKYSNNTVKDCFIITNVISLVYLAISKKRLEKLINFISINIGFVLYVLVNLLMFMFVFQSHQGNTLMGFERYMQTYMLAMLLNLIYIILENINIKNVIITIIMLLIIQDELNKLMIDPRIVKRSSTDPRIIQNANNIINEVEETEKVYIIDQKLDYGMEFMQMRYLISPRETNLLYEWNIGKSTEGVYYKIAFTEQEFLDKLIQEEYDYIYIIAVNENFLEDYKNIFSEEMKEKIKNVLIQSEYMFEFVYENGVLIKVEDVINNVNL